MTETQEKHLQEIVRLSGELIEMKYRKGQEEHGGNLFDLSASDLCDQAIMEAIDQMVYLITLKSKLTDFKAKFEVKERK